MSKPKQLGGLKLKDKEKTGFTAVYDMINSGSGNVTLLTYQSLKGFMFILNVSEEDSEYLTLNNKQTRFDKPVTSFILKFAVIKPNNDEQLDTYKGIKKSSESRASYFDEAKLQQHIWKKSIQGGRPEICPGVANFSLFDNSNSRDLMTFMRNKTSDKTKDVFQYLLGCVNKSAEIGVIVMPNIENSTTFGTFLGSSSRDDRKMAYALVAAQICKLFINIGVIHFDLHLGNALIYLAPDNTIKSLIIDFGRASNIMDDTKDVYLNKGEKQAMRLDKDTYFHNLFALKDEADYKKGAFILDILNRIAAIDLQKNQRLFSYASPTEYQMDWYENFPKDLSTPDSVPVMTYNILLDITVSHDKLLPGTFKKYVKDGILIDFERNVSTFVVPFPGTTSGPALSKPFASGPPPAPSISPSTVTEPLSNCNNQDSNGVCIISGGRKNKKSKKQRKSKTHKTQKNRKQKFA